MSIDMDFDGVVTWLRARLGRPVVVSVQGAGEAVRNTTVSASGPLLVRDDGEITLIDPPPGRVEAFAVGGATVVLLEGDFESAGATDFGTGGADALVQAQVGGLLITFAEVPRAAG
jgi:hypothetical protein